MSKMFFPMLAAAGVVFVSAAQATTVDPLPIMNGAAAIVLNNFESSGTDHIEGPLYVGGDLDFTGTFKYNDDQVPELDIGGVQGGLVVGGDVNSSLSKSGANPGATQIGGTYTGNANTGGLDLNDGVSGIPVAEMTSAFNELSSDLQGLSDTVGSGVDTLVNNKKVISGAGDADGIAVLNLDETMALDMFSPMFNENINLVMDSGVSAFIINVAGEFFTGANAINAQIFQNQRSTATKVIFNFYDALAIDFDSIFIGTLLAPNAVVNSAPGGSEGLLIAKDLIQDGEIRLLGGGGYTGILPPTTPPVEPPTTPVPLPAAGWILLGGIATLGAMRKRKAAV
ncbi:MAG: collagen-binding domain-containing protein [Pseudomonadota bacterium]